MLQIKKKLCIQREDYSLKTKAINSEDKHKNTNRYRWLNLKNFVGSIFCYSYFLLLLTPTVCNCDFTTFGQSLSTGALFHFYIFSWGRLSAYRKYYDQWVTETYNKAKYKANFTNHPGVIADLNKKCSFFRSGSATKKLSDSSVCLIVFPFPPFPSACSFCSKLYFPSRARLWDHRGLNGSFNNEIIIATAER